MTQPEPIYNIKAANMASCRIWKNKKGEEHPRFDIAQAQFGVSLTHHKVPPEEYKDLDLILHASVVLGRKHSKIKDWTSKNIQDSLKNSDNRWLVFLCGGPGAPNPPDRNDQFTEYFVDRGYTILFLDYRGTGKSIDVIGQDEESNLALQACRNYFKFVRPVDEHPTDPLSPKEVKGAADMFILLREDNIVRDLESIRKCLLVSENGELRKWETFGQSYGGWITISYLSRHPEGLERCTTTAGLAPITETAVNANRALFKTVVARNDEYYKRYPEDIKRVNAVVRFLNKRERENRPVELPSHDYLSFRRFLCMGRNLGLLRRWEDMHKVIDMFYKDITTGPKRIQTESMIEFEELDSWKFNNRPVYAILHEAMYCTQGGRSGWAAQEAAMERPQYQWLKLSDWNPASDEEKIYFSGEMVYPFMFKDYRRLAKDVSRIAHEIAQSILPPTFIWNDFGSQVGLYALSYPDDFHVNNELSEKTWEEIRGGGRRRGRHMIADKATGLEHSSIRENWPGVRKCLEILWLGE